MNASFCRHIIIAVFCLVMAAPATAASSTPASYNEELTGKLHAFGVQLAESYNRTVNGSKARKTIQKNTDGTYTAIYHEIDLDSITASFKESSDPKGPVKYIGILTYAEVKHVSTAPTRAEAEKGPFTASRSTTTELVKYIRGRWTY